MHIYYKFGLVLIFILSISACYTRAAAAAKATLRTNHSLTYDDDYSDDYGDYYDENDNLTHNPNRLMPIVVTTTTTTTSPLFNNINIPTRSNHVLEPSCPKACFCLGHKYIKCSNMQLTTVPPDLPSTALIIDLSENRIKELHASDFENCSRVLEINLSGNELTQVDKEVFDGLHRLQRLRLANNRLTEIEPDTFAGASDLRELDLSNNSIVLREEDSFLIHPGLLDLSCRNCSWTQLYDDSFANLSSLNSLKLDQNDFNKKINTKAFTPLRNLIKLKLPELKQASVEELCNLLKSIDNISFKHFDISCYELVLGASFNDSLIFATETPHKPSQPATTTIAAPPAQHSSSGNNSSNSKQKKGNQQKPEIMSNVGNATIIYNATLPEDNDNGTTVLTASVFNTAATAPSKIGENEEDKAYQVPVSQEAINIMLISIMIIAAIGIVIGVICRKDVGGIKTKCCRTRKPEPKDQVHPTEEIPLNKLA